LFVSFQTQLGKTSTQTKVEQWFSWQQDLCSANTQMDHYYRKYKTSHWHVVLHIHQLI